MQPGVRVTLVALYTKRSLMQMYIGSLRPLDPLKDKQGYEEQDRCTCALVHVSVRLCVCVSP